MKINNKKTKLLEQGINECGEVMLGNEKIDQVGIFTYLGCIVREDAKSRIANAHGFFFVLQLKKKLWKNRKISLRTKIKIFGIAQNLTIS